MKTPITEKVLRQVLAFVEKNYNAGSVSMQKFQDEFPQFQWEAERFSLALNRLGYIVNKTNPDPAKWYLPI